MSENSRQSDSNEQLFMRMIANGDTSALAELLARGFSQRQIDIGMFVAFLSMPEISPELVALFEEFKKEHPEDAKLVQEFLMKDAS